MRTVRWPAVDGHTDEVHVWYGRMDEAATSEAFLRRVLARYADAEPEELLLARAPCRRCGDAHGKPYLASHPDVHFNLSHSAALIAVAVSLAHEVGVDVQILKAKSRTDALAARFFSLQETAYLEAMTGDERREAFFQLWARKEACLKATGDGLSGGLSSIDVSGPGRRRSIVRADGTRWSVADLLAAPGFVGAVASSEGDWRVEEREESSL